MKSKKSNITKIPPNTITLVLTFKCTAQCRNCCFGCSPAKDRVMSNNEIEKYISSCMDAFPKSIKVLVITGGECMIYPNKVKYTIKLAKKYGLTTRIITNGFWASTYTKAKAILEDLKKHGLDEINFSTGDDHTEWIPLKNVRNASVAAARVGFSPFINIETHDESSPRILKFLGRDSVFMKFVENKKISMNRGAWMSFDKKRSISHKECIPIVRYEPCSNLFSMIPINPYGEVLACCGLPSEYIPYLRLGNFDSEPIKTKYLDSFEDLLKIWLFLDGPAKIIKFINEQLGIPNTLPSGHICDYCRTLFSTPLYMNFLKENYHNFMGDIIFKYSIYTNKLNQVNYED